MTLTKQQIDQWRPYIDYWRKKYADLGFRYDTLVYQTSQPDCRTCDHKFVDGWGDNLCDRSDCTNGDKYEPSKRVVLWRTE